MQQALNYCGILSQQKITQQMIQKKKQTGKMQDTKQVNYIEICQNGFNKAFKDFGKTLKDNTIDIDNIEELDTYETVETYDWQDVDTNRMTINELVQAVKQLNKEIKSIKENK